MGKNTNSIIEINGKRYDAITGAFLGNSSNQPARATRSVDGFRPSTPQLYPRQLTEREAAENLKPHKPAPSRTLMRTAVKKPVIQSPATLKAQARTDILARTPKQTVAPKLSYNSVDPSRLKKATQMVQNPSVSHYGDVTAVPVTPVSYAPANNPPLKKTLESFTTPKASTIPNVPVRDMRTPAKQPDIFEQAMARATSHEQTFDDSKVRRKSARWGFILSGILSLLLLVGAVAYFNVPQLSMRLASSRAGFTAKLPTYNPVGYNFGNLSYGPGNVTISYKADDAHKFDITQRSSQWDSQALLTNFVASANKAYQTYERAGRTIYFFGNNTATWVDNGVWYTVNGNNSLTKNQLLDLAGSI